MKLGVRICGLDLLRGAGTTVGVGYFGMLHSPTRALHLRACRVTGNDTCRVFRLVGKRIPMTTRHEYRFRLRGDEDGLEAPVAGEPRGVASVAPVGLATVLFAPLEGGGVDDPSTEVACFL